MTKIPNSKFIIVLLSIFCFLFFAALVSAAQMFLDAKTTQVQIGEKFEVNLSVNAEKDYINAFEGKIIFPSDLLDLKEIRDGNTIVNFWIEKPHSLWMTANTETNNNEIIFSGVTPGGFNGGNGLIFSAIFEAKKEGTANFEINDARVLRNDGTGSAAVLAVAPFKIMISKGASAEIPALPKIEDREQPESFAPEIAKDESIFGGKWFVVFVAQDKASGIDHYEIKESRQELFSIFDNWVTAESPYILNDQELRSFIFMKAIDKSGNKRIIRIAPRNALPWYKNYENWVIIIAGILMALFAAKKVCQVVKVRLSGGSNN
ncbi:MAG: cohesin domain-containing protein [Spirochaetota bacterium]